MAFVRSKKVNGYRYYQLVKSERVDGKHRQKVLMHLGRHETPQEAIKEWERRARINRMLSTYSKTPNKRNTYAEKLEEKAARLRALCDD